MRKKVILVLCIIFSSVLTPSAHAELPVDFSVYTTEQLLAVQQAVKDELSDRLAVREKPSPLEDFLYASNGSEIKITAYIGKGGRVVIPDEIEGLPVTILGESAFEENKTLADIVLPKGLRIIGANCFDDSSLSGELVLPESVSEIQRYAFYKTNISGTLILPATFTEVHYAAFWFTDITALIIQSDCSIDVAFYSCSELKSIYIRENCSPKIDEAFVVCSALEIAVIPSAVNKIIDEAFYSDTLLKIITPAGSYAEDYAKRNFIRYETGTYDEYVAYFENLYFGGK